MTRADAPAGETARRPAAELLTLSRRRRSAWLELDDPPRRAVQIRRPLDADMLAYRSRRDGRVMVDMVIAAAIDWRNFTSADVLGVDQGSDDLAEFSDELFAEWAADHVLEAQQLAGLLLDKIEAHTAALKAEAKNSPTS